MLRPNQLYSVFYYALNGIISKIEQNNYSKALDPFGVRSINKDSLLFYYGNIHSQRGQDGILAEIFRRIDIWNGIFIEFGAWDGLYLSNSRFLFEKGWGGIFIEGNKNRCEKLKFNYTDFNNIHVVNSFVGAPNFGFPGESLKDIVERTPLGLEQITFVSIDIDGGDLEVFQDMQFSPPVVLIEGGFNFSPFLKDPIPLSVAWNNLQQPISVIIETASKLGYEPVCFYQDLFFVRKDLMSPFLSIKRDAHSLYSDAYNFMPKDFREALFKLRMNNKSIEEFEKKAFGLFNPDPLGYKL